MGKVRTMWTDESVLLEAKKYMNISKFIKLAKGAYSYAKTHNLLDEATAHMVTLKRTWTTEEVHEEALKYTTRTDFATFSQGAYSRAHTNGFLDEACSHMSSKYTRITVDAIKIAASNYTTIREFREDHDNLYRAALRKDLKVELLGHLAGLYSVWTKELLIAEGLKYKNKTAFLQSNESAYTAAVKEGILDEVCSHMSGTRERTANLFGIPLDTTGLYGLYAEGQLVYIGKSTKCINTRINSHLHSKDFDQVIVLSMETWADIHVMELYYINKHNPKYNRDSSSTSHLNVVISNEDAVVTKTTTYNKKDMDRE